jgi:branched-chain amino acid transport system permease protein
VLVALLLLYAKTPFGRVVRACVEDREAASLMGINVRRVNLQVLVIAGALAGLGGGLILPLFPITPFVGSTLTINAFLAAIIGGLRRVQGAVLGALVIGVATALNAQYGFTIWTSAEIYGLLIVILLIRPTGLLGNRAW